MAKRVRRSRIMTTNDYIQQLTQLFDDKFRRPTSFYNNGCCVGDDEARLLIETPRAKLTEEELSSPIDHACGCFGTFEQMAYYVPRLFEFLNESEDGFTHGCLNYSFFRLLVRHEQQYRDLELWDSIECSMNSLFVDRTSVVEMKNNDYIINEQIIDEMLPGFFMPVLSVRQSTTNLGQTQWDEFILRWADDTDACRLMHVLAMVKRYSNGHLSECPPPEVFLARLRDREYTSSLLKRAEPAVAFISPDSWMDEVRGCLEVWSVV
ncbi:MAG: hypothetical protein ACYC1M_02865 [Armatimonadota bacterium]